MSGPTYTDQLQEIVATYRDCGQAWPATTNQIAAWAYRMKFWQPQPSRVIGQLAEQLARAMREEYIVDAHGREVRTKHAARTERDGVQGTFWADIRTATRDHMEIALQQRRQQIVGDCRQLSVDATFYNEHHNPGSPIQLVFDFTEDLAEIEAMETLGMSV